MLLHTPPSVSLSNCDREPIHLIGSIQPHGFLLVLQQPSLVVEQCSKNVAEFLNHPVNEVLGQPLTALFREFNLAALHKVTAQAAAAPLLLRTQDNQFFGYAHVRAGKLILEAEPFAALAQEEALETSHSFTQTQQALNQCNDVAALAALLADTIQEALDFDRVLVFKFEEDNSAEVIAEKAKPAQHSFMGHHFPASDIPAPARALLKTKHIRHIPDVKAAPVAIVPYQHPVTGAPTDILQSELRYPSTIHLEYLQNMGVGASLSLSILIKGELWGIVSCTNEQPKLVSYWTRQHCNQLAKAFANVLVFSEEKRDLERFASYRRTEAKIIKQVISSGNIPQALLDHQEDILGITAATGAALLLDNSLVLLGTTPEKEQVQELVAWLHKHMTDAVFHTRALSDHVAAAGSFTKEASGLLALEISRFNREYLLFFRPELKEKKIWAGNPEKPLQEEGAQLHPRKSFADWEETVQGKSIPWRTNEREIAQILLKDLTAIRLGIQARRLEELNEEYQVTAEGLRLKNKQLEDFAHIVAHNLRSPLNNIKALYSIYQETPEQAEAPQFLEKINTATNNMLATIEDLNKLLKTRLVQQLSRDNVDIQQLVTKELQNLEATITKTDAEITTELLAPTIKTHKVYLESILHNLISNALKYSSSERQPQIAIKTWQDDKIYLSVSDNGLGIDLKKHGHKLFRLYQTFHQSKNAKGLGLYLTKLQIESLGGSISVSSQPDVGTTFTVAFNNITAS